MKLSANLFRPGIACCWLLVIEIVVAALPVHAQVNTGDNGADTKTELRLLHSELSETQRQLLQAQERIAQLAGELDGLRRDFAAIAPRSAQNSGGEPAAFPSAVDLARQPPSDVQALSESIADLSASQKLLAAQLEEQHQTKVESESKYRVKLVGLVLMNVFSNRGDFDLPDLPQRAIPSDESGSVGASVRQSILGLQVFGPKLGGADTSASISADFFGGFPRQQPYGTTLGLVRLRQASAHLDWADTSLVIGQESLFLSPLSPTSYATVAEPAFSYAGNLWAWAPQVVAEHRLHVSDQTYFSVSGGLLAPLADFVASNQSPYVNYVGPGGRARRPAFGALLALHTKQSNQPLDVGFGAYAGRLDYEYGRKVNSWAVTSFLRLPIGSRFELSGEAYRGSAVGGLGGGIWQSVVFNGDPANAGSSVRPLNAFGGWTQLKFRPHPKWEMNSAIAQDNILAADLEWAPSLVGLYLPPLARNRAALGNVIFRPRSDLLLSLEYRKVWTYGYKGIGDTGDQVNVGAAVSF